MRVNPGNRWLQSSFVCFLALAKIFIFAFSLLNTECSAFSGICVHLWCSPNRTRKQGDFDVT